MYKTALLIVMMFLLAGCGQESDSSSITTPTIPTMASMQIQLVSMDEEQVVLSWDQVEAATHYQLYWSDTEDERYDESVTVEGITYTHRVFGDTTYHYYVVAMQEDKEVTLPSEVIVVKVTKKPVSPPSDTI